MGLAQAADEGDKPGKVRLQVQTPEGDYETEATWAVACDGAGSPVRLILRMIPPCLVPPDARHQ